MGNTILGPTTATFVPGNKTISFRFHPEMPGKILAVRFDAISEGFEKPPYVFVDGILVGTYNVISQRMLLNRIEPEQRSFIPGMVITLLVSIDHTLHPGQKVDVTAEVACETLLPDNPNH